MAKIVVDEQQARAVAAAEDTLEIVAPDGRRVGYAVREFTAAEIAAAKRAHASDQPRRTTAEVLESLKSLDRQ